MTDPPRWTRYIRAGLLAVALGGCVANLGAGTYWHDEALTVFLGRTVAQTGLPMAWDGRNFVEWEYEHQFNDALVWTGHAWLPFYIVGGVAKLGGSTPGIMRLPFALGGWLALLLLYPAARAILRSNRAAFWTLVTGVSSVPFYLYARQCAYYPLLVLGGVLVWWALAQIPERPRMAYVLAAGLMLLAFCQPVAGFAVAPACFLATLRHRRQWRICLRYVIPGAVALAAFLLFSWYAESVQMLQSYSTKGLPFRVGAPLKIWRLLTEANLWILPFAATPLVVWAGVRPPASSPHSDHAEPVAVRRLALDAILGLFAVGMVAPDPFFRYVLPLMVPAFLLLGSALARACAWRRWWGIGLAATLLGTQVWQTAGHRALALMLDRVAPRGYMRAGLGRLEPYAHRWSSHHAQFLYELTHPYSGPVDAILAFLREHAEPGQLIAITYPRESVALFTDLRTVGALSPTAPVAVSLPAYVSHIGVPDWVIVRAQYPNRLFDAEAFFRRYGNEYRIHDLGVPDVTWNNRPYLLAHYFRSPTAGPPLLVYERVRPAAP